MLRLSNFRHLRNCEVGFVERVTLDLGRGLYKPQRRLSVVSIPCPSTLWYLILRSTWVFVVVRSYLASDAAMGNIRDFAVRHGCLCPLESVSCEHRLYSDGTLDAQIQGQT